MSIVNAIAFDEIRIQRNPGGGYVTVDAEEIIKNFDAKLTSWSKEPPTEPGWYWVNIVGNASLPEAVRLYGQSGAIVIQHRDGHGVSSYTDVSTYPTEIYRWQKMNVPQPPKE